MPRKLIIMLALLAVLSLSCNLITGSVPTPEATAPVLPNTNTPQAIIPGPEPGEDTPGSTPFFGPIVFGEYVTEEGVVLNESTTYPGGTTEVWAYFTYEGMLDGQTWGHLWEENGETSYDGRGESWDEGESGWTAYTFYDEGGIPLGGNYTLTLYIGDEPVQQASFEVVAPDQASHEGFAAFGPIQFALDITEDTVPVGTDTQFEAGIPEVYAVFPFNNMSPDQSWQRVWLQDGEVTAESDLIEWDEGTDGITYSYLWDEEGLDPGIYTLNLYIDDQLARSADFEVLGEPPPADPDPSGPIGPEDLIDPDLMPAWDMLINSSNPLLYQLADLVLAFKVEVRMVDSLSGSAIAVYSYDPDTCQITEKGKRTPGGVKVSREKWQEQAWEQVAASIAHELTHAFQHLNANYRCEGCSIQKEYEAFLVTIHALDELGRLDLAQAEYPGVVDDQGYIDKDLLWKAIKASYEGCPDY